MSSPATGALGPSGSAVPPAAVPPAAVSVWNVANLLTGLRLLLVPVFAALLLHRSGELAAWRWAAFAVFFLASLTDRFDGQLARSRGLVTDVGKIADPIADKALMGTALVGLSLLDRLPWWVTLLVLSREIGVTVLRLVVIRHGVIAASRGGKLKTLLQSIAIGLLILPVSGALLVVGEVIMAAAVVVTSVTGVDYVVKAWNLRAHSELTAARRASRASARHR